MNTEVKVKETKRPRTRKGFTLQEQLKGGRRLYSTVFFDLKERRKEVKCTIAVYGLPGNDVKEFRATAYCHEQDVFNVDEGIQIAFDKAKERYRDYMDNQIDLMVSRMNLIISTVENMVTRRHDKMVRNKKYKLR
jgi:hypothetical protein